MIICVTFAALFAGCAHETMLQTSQPGPPAWKLTPPKPSDGKVFFVGRSLGVSVLDERNAINTAIDDAAYQIARAIVADVSGQVTIIDSRKAEDRRRGGLTGEAVRATGNIVRSSHDEVMVDVASVVSGITQENAYWEQWSVREYFRGPKSRRYMYWILVSFPEAELKRCQDDVKKKLKIR